MTEIQTTKGSSNNGFVTLTTPEGNKYEGKFKDGLPHGKVKVTNPNGDIYEGGFWDGVKHGKGKDTFRDGFQLIEIDTMFIRGFQCFIETK